MAYRLATRAEADLDEIADYIAAESGSLDTATRVVEALAARFLFLAENPYAGRAGTGWRPRARSEKLPPPTAMSSFTASLGGTS